MSTESRIFLIPRNNSFKPDAESLARFLDELRKGAWICDPEAPDFAALTFTTMRQSAFASKTGAYCKVSVSTGKGSNADSGYAAFPTANVAIWLRARGDADFRIVWPVENYEAVSSSLRYPLDWSNPLSPDAIYYDLELWVSHDYVYKTAEAIDPFDDEHCHCGAPLTYDAEEEGGALFYALRMRARCPECGRPFDPSERSALVRDPWTGLESEVRGGATFRFALVVDCGKCIPRDPISVRLKKELRQLCEYHWQQRFYEIVELY
jgi:hypothetical protein